MNWDQEKTLHFIKEFEARPVLWRKDDEDFYKNRSNGKNDAWLEIAAIMDEDVDVLRKKMDSLRGSRRREKSRNKIREIEKGRGKPYKSKWFAWESMKFLSDTEDAEDIKDQMDSTMPSPSSIKSEDELIIKSERIEESEDEYDADDDIDVTSEKQSSAKKEFSSINEPPVKKRKRETQIQEFYNFLKLAQTSLAIGKDECGLFGDFIAEKLRKIDPSTRARLQHQIHHQIFEAELNQMNHQIPPA